MLKFNSSKFSSKIKTCQLKIYILNKVLEILLQYSHIYINMNHIIAYLHDNMKWKWKSLSVAALFFTLTFNRNLIITGCLKTISNKLAGNVINSKYSCR